MEIFKRTFYLPRQIPALTGFAIFICGLAFVLYHLAPESSPSWLGLWGFSDSWQIYREGQFWALLTSSLVHHEPMHIFLNLYWVWILGRVLEEEIGTLNALLFWIAAGFVSSGCEFLVNGETGIGASGVVYAIFGYEWTARHRVERFAEVLQSNTIRLFIVWLFACVLLDWWGMLSVANGAHFGGFIFGALLGYLLEVRVQPRLGLTVAGALVLLSVGQVFYAPWSSVWCFFQGYKKSEKDPVTAIYWFDRVRPENPIYSLAVLGRSEARDSTGDRAGAMADLEKALAITQDGKDRIYILNTLAWDYATNKDSKIRNGSRAVAYALEANELGKWKDPACLDTLAAAYARVENYADAVKWQTMAIELKKKTEKTVELNDFESRLGLYEKHQPYVE